MSPKLCQSACTGLIPVSYFYSQCRHPSLSLLISVNHNWRKMTKNIQAPEHATDKIKDLQIEQISQTSKVFNSEVNMWPAMRKSTSRTKLLKSACLVWIDAEFHEELSSLRTKLQMDPSCGLKIIPGLSAHEIAIFQETERWSSMYSNSQCLYVVAANNGFHGKGMAVYGEKGGSFQASKSW